MCTHSGLLINIKLTARMRSLGWCQWYSVRRRNSTYFTSNREFKYLMPLGCFRGDAWAEKTNVNSAWKFILVQRSWSFLCMQHLWAIQNCWNFRKRMKHLNLLPVFAEFLSTTYFFLGLIIFFLIISRCVALNISLCQFNQSGRNPESLGHLCFLKNSRRNSFSCDIIVLGPKKVAALSSFWSKSVLYLKINRWPFGVSDYKSQTSVRGFSWLIRLLEEFNCKQESHIS